jgi:hypothetical protein
VQLCGQAGFRKIELRGDTDFSQTRYLDGWDSDSRIRFYFGYDATPNLKEIADNLPKSAWQPLQRPARYSVKTQPRWRRPNFKEQVVKEREFENLRLVSEDVAEFDYRPAACRKTYRMVVVRKNISVEKGEQVLFPDERYFFYITNERECTAAEVVYEANPGAPGLQSRKPHRPTERRRAGVARARGQLGEQLGVHADDGLSLEPESLVGVDAARRSRPLARETSRRQTMGAETGIQDVLEHIHAPAVPNHQDRPQTGLPLVELEPALTHLLPAARCVALLNCCQSMSGSGCPDPPQRRTLYSRKEKLNTNRNAMDHSGVSASPGACCTRRTKNLSRLTRRLRLFKE